MAKRDVNLRPNSRARMSMLQHLGDFQWFGPPSYPEFPEKDDDDWIESATDTAIDGLAQEYYGTPELWWVIAIANGIELWPSDVPVGSRLRIPSKDNVLSVLRKPRRT